MENKVKQHFSSALELIKLIDSALGEYDIRHNCAAGKPAVFFCLFHKLHEIFTEPLHKEKQRKLF